MKERVYLFNRVWEISNESKIYLSISCAIMMIFSFAACRNGGLLDPSPGITISPNVTDDGDGDMSPDLSPDLSLTLV